MGVTHEDLIICGFIDSRLSAAQATTVVYKDLQDLVQEADRIVAGTVTDVQARYGRTENIYTLVKLQDLQVLAGSYKGSEFYVRLLGGEVQGDVLDVRAARSSRLATRSCCSYRGTASRSCRSSVGARVSSASKISLADRSSPTATAISPGYR